MSQVIDLTGSSPAVSTRQTRSSTRQKLSPTASLSTKTQTSNPSSRKPTIEDLPPTQSLSCLSRLKGPFTSKRTWLASHTIPLPQDVLRSLVVSPKTYLNPVDATYLFARSDAGTAVCISPDGVLLTCAHCVAEKASELATTPLHTLISSSGKLVSANVIAWDPIRDLALLLINQAELPHRPFPHARIASFPPRFNTKLLCVGHPGSEDLQAETQGVKTGYDPLVLSEGTFRGLAQGQDPQDNSCIGALKHNCWTYWGHSGAGLFDRKTGVLVGVHSSWDEVTGMRRGVPLEAVVAFLEEFEVSRREGMGDGWQWYVR
ncbi:hypothetical protein ACHAPJ_003353 [Fusarium lateritium]